MKLVIVESPAKAKTIGKYLGKDFEVKASVGHVRDLPKSNKLAIDIEGGFIPHYEISKGKELVIEEIKRLAKKADEILLATDPDREGEAIAWHLKELIIDKKNKKPIKRISYTEITKEAISEALAHPRKIDEDLRKAQEARRVLDRLVGYDLSGIIWKKVRYGLSAGRVQSPALRIIMEREREIRAFVPEEYFVIGGEFTCPPCSELSGEGRRDAENNNILILECEKKPTERNEAKRIVEIAEKAKETNSWKVKSIEKTEVKRSSKAPFITSTLQQTASTRLGYSPSNTMRIAQKLYEAGFITYMRTDSPSLSTFAIESIAEKIKKTYGEKYLDSKNFASKSKSAQEAHEAIRPSDIFKENAGANDDEKKLYRLIWQRTIASQMSNAMTERTKISANVSPRSGQGEIPNFSITGSIIIFDGWLKADPEGAGEDRILPQLKENDPLKLIKLIMDEKWTEPPGRYSEAGLIKELEKRGIGRPSTYASIIRTLETREYVTKENKALKPTDTGDVVSTFLEANFSHYISDGFTAEMEEKLDEIAEGKAEYAKVLENYYTPLHKEVIEKDKLDKATTFGEADPKYKCPKCGSSMLVKLSRAGKFLSCSRYPDCDGALSIDGLEIKKDEPIGIDPTTNLPIFTKIGRFGPYVQLGEMPPKKVKTPKIKVPKVKKTKAEREVEKEAKANEPKPVKPKMASIPKEYNPAEITLADALKFLSIPKVLGKHPVTNLDVVANNGRFGPYVSHDGNYRSIKKPLNVFDITFDEAMALLAQEKKPRGFQKKVKKE
ncbi:MAG: type I DNA topoisomerase [Candidatus Paceibacterota bacterium]